MPQPLRIGLVVNPAARAGRDQRSRWAELERRLTDAGHALDVRVTRGPRDGFRLAAELASGSDVLLAVGGDGTLCEVVEALVKITNGPVPLVAPVAFGTGNDVARVFGLMEDAALVRALHGVARRDPAWMGMDVLEVRCQVGGREVVRHGLLFAAVGFASDVLRLTTPRLKRWLGPQWSYYAGFFRALAGWNPVDLRVRTSRGELAEPLVVALAANAPHAGGGGMRIGPGAHMDDGQGDVSLIRGLGRWTIARQFLRLVQGTHVRHPGVDYFRDSWMEVESSPPRPVVLDGDVIGETPMRMRVLPCAIRVLTGSPQRDQNPSR